MLTRRTVLGALVVGALARPALAQTFPNRAMRIVVPFAPGGAGDIGARTVGAQVSEMFGQPVLIENRPGVVVGSEIVARAAPDGYTLLIAAASITIMPSMKRPPAFDIRTSFAPVSPLLALPYVVLANKDAPFRTLAELIAYAKANPGKVNYASNGHGTSTHLVGELLKQRAGIDMVHVPYRGSGPQTVALISGEVQVSVDGFGPTTPLIRDGSVRVLALTADRPVAALPDAPLAQVDIPGFAPVGWIGLLAPAGVPPETLGTLNRAVVQAVASPAVRERFATLGFEPVTSSVEAFRQSLNEEVETWRRVIEEAKLELD